MNFKEKKCPRCNSIDLRIGEFKGYANIIISAFKSSPVRCSVCSDCGYIVEQYVTKPSSFKKAKKVFSD